MATTKKKTMLLVTAIALVAVLAVVGTLMLFTAQSETAKNVVTLGNAKIVLEENGGDLTDDEYLEVGKDYDGEEFTGIDYNPSFIGPDRTVTKKPRITNTGNINVYVALKVKLSAKSDGQDATISSEDFAKILGGINFTDRWFASAPTSNSDGSVEGIFYFVDDNDTELPDRSQLYQLLPGVSTADLFTEITLPDDLSVTLANADLSLEITGYAAQVENSPYDGTDGSVTEPVEMKTAFGTLLN